MKYQNNEFNHIPDISTLIKILIAQSQHGIWNSLVDQLVEIHADSYCCN